ncbi:hypothetical protein [Pseudodesulfovibrio indicus]|uniref:hypothetical protein n=1 Tax=Pseudodesulfovibrio indicus TaxID=1716143 RepID=UPI00292E148F|nr:hypothetical protein [Pseudodesulfovibrio indicus]
MATQPIEQTLQGYTYKRPKRTSSDAEFSLAPEESKSRRTDQPQSGSVLRGYLRDLLAEAVPAGEDRLSFVDVENHHAALLASWNDEVKSQLAGLGVDTSVPFRLLHDPAGAATVTGSHPDSEMVNAYFAANPDRVAELGKTLQFGKLAATARNRLSNSDMDRPLTTEAMAWWYATNMDSSQLFSTTGTVVGAGNTPYKGLDIRV